MTKNLEAAVALAKANGHEMREGGVRSMGTDVRTTWRCVTCGDCVTEIIRDGKLVAVSGLAINAACQG